MTGPVFLDAIGSWLHAQMTDRGLTVADAATASGITPARVTEILAGDAFTLTEIGALAELFGTTGAEAMKSVAEATFPGMGPKLYLRQGSRTGDHWPSVILTAAPPHRP